jgi:hypothetical protein
MGLQVTELITNNLCFDLHQAIEQWQDPLCPTHSISRPAHLFSVAPLIVRDERQLAEVRDKVMQKYGLKLISGFRCAFRDPFGNRIDVVDLHDESLTWLLP